MNKSKIFIGIILLLCLMQSTYSQTVMTSFAENLKSGALANSISNLFKNSIFLWYTTVGGELNPQYASQRMVLDSLLFFVIFFYVIKYALGKVWKDVDKKSKTGLSVALGIVLSLSFTSTGASVGFLLPFVKNIGVVVLAGLIAFGINKATNKENKPGKILVSILISFAISWLLFNSLNLLQGNSPSLLGGVFNTEKKSDLSARMITGGYAGDPAGNYQLALAAVQSKDYDKARDYFLRVVEAGPSSPYFAKTSAWLTIKGGDKLFKEIARNYPVIIATEITAAEILLDKGDELKREAAALQDSDPKKKELLDRAKGYGAKAVVYINDAMEKQQYLQSELKKRGVAV